MDDTEDLNEKVLDITQRQKRARVLRAHRQKIERARELAQKRLAPEKNIKKRAYAQARQIVRQRFAGQRGAEYEKLGPSEKMAIDRAIEKKTALIKKIALRLIPKVKRAEQQRLQAFTHGQAVQNQGAPEAHKPPVNESLNALFEQEMGELQMSPGTDKEKIDKKQAKKKSPIVQYAKFSEESDNVSAVYMAIAKKAGKSGIDIDILGEVYDRGMAAWDSDMNVSQQQYAFARVNSFINQGKTYFNEDADLHEGMGNTLIKKSDATHQTNATIWPDSDNPQKLSTLYHRSEGEVKNHIKSLKKKYGASNVKVDVKKLSEGREPREGKIVRYKRPDGTTALKSLNKWGKRKDWRDTEGGLAKAKEHSGAETVREDIQIDESEDRTQRIMHKGKHVANIRTYKGRAGGLLSQVEHPDGSDASKKYGIGMMDTKKEIVSKIKKHHSVNEEVQIRENIGGVFKDSSEWEKSAKARGLTVKSATHPSGEMTKYQIAKDKNGNNRGHFDHGTKSGRLKEEVQQSNENFSNIEELSTATVTAYRRGMEKDVAMNRNMDPRKKAQREKAFKTSTKKILGLAKVNATESLKDPEDNPCWKDYKPVGTKKLRGKTVPNCVPMNEEERPDPKAKVVGTNCRNCVYWRKDLEKPVAKEELNPNGGLKAPNKEYIAMSKRIDLGTLPGKDTGVKIKGFCDHDMIKDWVTERMCCSQWDSDGMIRDYKGKSPVMEAEGESIVPQKTSPGSKIRKKLEVVDRKPPHTEYTRQAEIKTKIIDEEGNSQPDPKKRLIGTDSLVKAYKKDTPGQCNESLNESFNIAYAAGVGVTLTAADLGMRAQGAFALHPSVVEEMERRAREQEEVEEAVTTADVKAEVVPAHTKTVVDPKSGAQKQVTVPGHVRRAKKNKTIIPSGSVTDGMPG